EWRLGLRDKQLLEPPGGRIKDIDPRVMHIVEEHWELLIEPGTRSIQTSRFPAPMMRRRMKTMNDARKRFVFLGSKKGMLKEPLPPHVSVCHDDNEVELAVAAPTRRATWVSFTRHFTDVLLEKAVDTRADLRGSHLITLTPPRSESIAALIGLFHPV